MDLRKKMLKLVYKTDKIDSSRWKDFCFIWKVLSAEERRRVHPSVLALNAKSVDLCHVFSRSSRPDLKDDIFNVVFIARGFHFCLTNFVSFFDLKRIDKYEVYHWYLKANSKQLQYIIGGFGYEYF